MIIISILQEYEKIRKEIGNDKWDSIDNYINYYHPELYLSDIIYNPHNYNEFNCWYNENIKLRNIKILNIWDSDYDDVRCNAILYKNNKEVANIIASYDKSAIKYDYGYSKNEIDKNSIRLNFKSLIYNDWDNYLKLPKISECSNLLQEIYDTVCESDATMCHISNEDWNDYYIDKYTDENVKNLETEIKKYGLDEVICIDDGEYKIIGYGDLETRFNDDRNINSLDMNNEEMELSL